MKIRDKSLQSAFESVIQDGDLSKKDVDTLLRSIQDHGKISETEKTDLENIYNELSTKLSSSAKQKWLSVLEPDFLSYGEKRQGMNPLNLTIAALQNESLEDMTLEGSQKIFEAAQQGGITFLEKEKLLQIQETYRNAWKSEIQAFWERRFGSHSPTHSGDR